MYIIKQVDIDMFKKYFNDILELKNYSSSLHFISSEIEEFNKKKLLEVYDYLEEEKAIIFGAFKNEKLIGYLWGYPHTFFNEKRIYINSLVVNKQFSGQGIGTKLLKKIEEYSVDNNYDSMDLNVVPSNEIAYNLYKKNNFEIERFQMRKVLK